MTDLLHDDTDIWQQNFAHVEEDDFDSVYNQPQQPEGGDAFTFSPCFIQLFGKCTMATNQTVNVDRHLMSL